MSEAGLWISESNFSGEVFGFCILSELPTNVLKCAVNPTYLIGCFDCLSVQPYPQDYCILCTNTKYNSQDGMLRISVLLEMI